MPTSFMMTYGEKCVGEEGGLASMAFVECSFASNKGLRFCGLMAGNWSYYRIFLNCRM